MNPNKPTRPTLASLLGAVAVFLLASPALAETPFVLGVFGGFGGSLDEGDAGLGHTAVMAKLAIESGPRSDFAVRLGEIDIDQLGQASSATLTYLTMSGDYWAYESFYESALYLGLGYYEISALQGFDPIEETTVGAVLGAAGEWDLTRRLSLQVELAGHYAPMDTAQAFIIAHAGIAVHF